MDVFSSFAAAGSCSIGAVIATGEVAVGGSGWVSTSEVNGTCSGSEAGAGSTGFCSVSIGSATAVLSVISGLGTEAVVSFGVKIELEGVVVDVVEGKEKIEGIASI